MDLRAVLLRAMAITGVAFVAMLFSYFVPCCLCHFSPCPCLQLFAPSWAGLLWLTVVSVSHCCSAASCPLYGLRYGFLAPLHHHGRCHRLPLSPASAFLLWGFWAVSGHVCIFFTCGVCYMASWTLISFVHVYMAIDVRFSVACLVSTLNDTEPSHWVGILEMSLFSMMESGQPRHHGMFALKKSCPFLRKKYIYIYVYIYIYMYVAGWID